jgi:hypothetical protein
MRPTLSAFLEQAVARPGADPELAARIAAVVAHLDLPDDPARPFLSVIVRTQGLRIEPLKDALLCLEAQDDDDFEVLVMMHDAAPADAQAVRDAVAAHPGAFRDRVRVIDVTGGTRSHPLNAGVDAAGGRYLAFYDDDDLLFAHWVSSFAEAAQASPGTLLRAVVANQSVEPETWPGGIGGFRSTAWPKPEWEAHFDFLGHLLVNKSPFMSWAFPRSVFSTFGVRFDEELVAAEDWDVILQAALLLGVTEVPALTSIYRRWSNAESSVTLHSTEAWQRSEQRVLEHLDRMVLTFPTGSVPELRTHVLYTEALRQYRVLFAGHELRRPLNSAWKVASPTVRFAVRVRNRLRRMRSR